MSIFEDISSLFFNVLIIAIIAVAALVMMGLIDVSELKDKFLGDVTIGETTQVFDESKFLDRFNVIVGEVEVHDSSATEFERHVPFCDKAYVKFVTDATIKYEVKTTDQTFVIDVEKQQYFISESLGVQQLETNRQTDLSIDESICIKEQDITLDQIEAARKRADQDFKTAVSRSPKLIDATIRFEMIKSQLITQLDSIGFVRLDSLPSERLLD